MPTAPLRSASPSEINRTTGAAALAEVADVSVAAHVSRYVAAATAAWGAVDAVVHAAGLPGPAAELAEFDQREFDRVMAVNARGTFLGLKYALPKMRDGGAIVNVASVSGPVGYPMVAAYLASKHAAIGLTRTAALEDAARGIRVNAICPGPIEGRLMYNHAAAGGMSTAPDQDPFLLGVPLARYGTPRRRSLRRSVSFSPRAPPSSPEQRSRLTAVDGFAELSLTAARRIGRIRGVSDLGAKRGPG